jgi:hypothetical protein
LGKQRQKEWGDKVPAFVISSTHWSFQGPHETFAGEHLEDAFWNSNKFKDELEVMQHYFPEMDQTVRKIISVAPRELDFDHRVIIPFSWNGLEANRKSAGSPSGTAEHPEDYAKRGTYWHGTSVAGLFSILEEGFRNSRSAGTVSRLWLAGQMVGDIREGAMYVSKSPACAEGYPNHFSMGRGEFLTRSSEQAVRVVLECRAHEHERMWHCRRHNNTQDGFRAKDVCVHAIDFIGVPGIDKNLDMSRWEKIQQTTTGMLHVKWDDSMSKKQISQNKKRFGQLMDKAEARLIPNDASLPKKPVWKRPLGAPWAAGRGKGARSGKARKAKKLDTGSGGVTKENQGIPVLAVSPSQGAMSLVLAVLPNQRAMLQVLAVLPNF